MGWRAMRRLNPLGVAGVVLLVLGLAALAYQGISYTSRETVIDLGPIHATAERQRTLPLPPIFGIAAVAAGVVLLMTGVRRPTT
jgi:membrane-bound ClpP family serine protease